MLETEFNLKEYGETLKNEGRKIGKQEGLEEGQKIGEKKQAIETCKQMIMDCLPVETIQKYTSLSKEEIIDIQNNLHVE